MKIIMIRLCGKLPKKTYTPSSTAEKLACLLHRKDNGTNPAKEQMRTIIDNVKSREFEVK